LYINGFEFWRHFNWETVYFKITIIYFQLILNYVYF